MRKTKGWTRMPMILLSLFGFAACGGEKGETLSYQQISINDAKAIMNTECERIRRDYRLAI